MTRHDLTELTTESFLEQAAVKRLCKHCRWAKPAWHAIPIALLFPSLWREFWRSATAAIRHRSIRHCATMSAANHRSRDG
jgi:hypothetical protein